MNLEFIPAERSDAEAIFSMLRELIDTYEDLSSIPYEKVLAWCHHQIEENIGEYTCVLWGGKKAGWYCLAPSDDGRMELDNFYVLPEYRGRGIGTTVLKRCFAAADKPYSCTVLQKTPARWPCISAWASAPLKMSDTPAASCKESRRNNYADR